MKFVTVNLESTGHSSTDWVGVLLPDSGSQSDLVVNIRQAIEDLFPSEDTCNYDDMMSIIYASGYSIPLAQKVIDALERDNLISNYATEVSQLSMRSPIPLPPQLRDCLLFEEHLSNAYAGLRSTRAAMEEDPDAALLRYEKQGLYQIPDVWYELPLYYKANRFSVIGHQQPIVKPDYTNKLDFELEFGCFLGEEVKNVTPAEAEEAIFGYAIFNDMSARDIQSREMQGQLGPTKSKDFDTGNVIGPCIVTSDSIDPYDCAMIARINGNEVCRGHSSTISRTFGEVIAYMSKNETLMPGEFIGSGTVGGGCGLEIGTYLDIGDTIELEVEGIGVLSNKIISG